MATTCQLLLRGLDGRTTCLRFPSTTVTGSLIGDRIAAILRLPVEALLIFTGTSLVHPHSSLSACSDGFFPSCTLVARLRGGKGGFGSLLRGAATKAGQKKTSNFDACRDMSGRRLRHVNAEKKLKEWKAQAKERELEKAANEFLKKQVKRKEDDSGFCQTIQKFREETSRAREEVESAVASGLAEAKRLGKRKVVDEDPSPSSSSKRSHVWFNGDIDMIEGELEGETDSSDDDNEAEEVPENEDDEGSVYSEAGEGSEAEKGLEDGRPNEVSDLVKAEDSFKGPADGKLGKVFEYAKAERGFQARSTCESSETSSEVEAENSSECKGEEWVREDNGDNGHTVQVEKNVHMVEIVNRNVTSCISSSSSPHCDGGLQKAELQNDLGTNTLPDSGGNGPAAACKRTQDVVNLGHFLHASDLEVLGLDQLKHELQTRGLKCGGSLAERAGRLFLLKSIPLEKLDKKHFAKARG